MEESLFANIGIAGRAIGWVFLPLVLWPALYLFLPRSHVLKSVSDTVIRTIDSLNYNIGEIIKWALPCLVASVAISVFALSIFGLSWTKLFESAKYFHAGAIMLGSAATLLAGQHVRVDVFHSRMSDTSRAVVDFCGFYALLLPVCLVIIWSSQSFVAFSWLIFEGSPEADGIRGEYLLKTLIPVFGTLMILQSLSIGLRAAMCLKGEARPARPVHTPPLFATDQTLETGARPAQAADVAP